MEKDDFLSYICDEVCGVRDLCLTQEQADKRCEKCKIESNLELLLQGAYRDGKIAALKYCSEKIKEI